MATDDTIVGGMASRYAAALFDLAKDAGQVPQIEGDLVKFGELLDVSPDLLRLVKSPVISSHDQGLALGAVMAKYDVSGLSANFIQLVARNRRLFAIPDMIRSFQQLAAKDRGEVTADVTSATALTADQIETLKASLKESIGKAVTLRTKVDASLLGGLIVKVGSRMVDSSLRTKLQGLKTALAGTA